MTELLNVGKRIKRFRISRSMTQKALGMAVGFPQETADVRIAQYESGARTPKRNLLCRMARVLGVSPSALAVPLLKTAKNCTACCARWKMSAVLSYPRNPILPQRFMNPTEKGAKNNENLRGYDYRNPAKDG